MDLEHRVLMLEQEMQILKGQIQATLLEIQEQVLTNTYPALRAEDLSQTAPTVPAPSKVPASSGYSQAKLETLVENDDELPAPSVVKRVNLNEINPPAKSLPEGKTRNERVNGSLHAPSASESTEDAGDDYAAAPTNGRHAQINDRQPSQGAAKLPKVRSVKLQDDYEDEEFDEAPPKRRSERPIAPDNRPPVRRSRAVQPPPEDSEDGEEDDLPKSANGRYPFPKTTSVPQRKSLPPQPEAIPSDESTTWIALKPLAEWVGQKVKAIGVNRTRDFVKQSAQKGHFTAEVKDALLQLVALYDEDGSLNTQGLDAVLEALSETPIPVQLKPLSNTEKDENQRLVLRLIAGVQNAGAGIVRRKKNG